MNLTLPLYTAFSTLPLVWLIATIGAFQLGTWLNRRGGGMPIINPVLIAMTLVICSGNWLASSLPQGPVT